MSLNLPDSAAHGGGREEGRQDRAWSRTRAASRRRIARSAAASRTARSTCITWSSRPISSAGRTSTCTASRGRGSTTCCGTTAATRSISRTGSSTSPNCEVWGQKGPDHPELGIPMDMTVAMKSKKGPLFTHGDVVQQQGTVRRLLPLHRRRGDLQGLPRFDDRQRRQGSRRSMPMLAFDRQDVEFVSAIREGREPESSAASCLPTMALLDRSISDGRRPMAQIAMIIDCHGHYTTAPKALQSLSRRADRGAEGSVARRRRKASVNISDDQIRESLESAQLKLQRERGTDVTIFSPRASAMAHHIGDATTSLHWSAALQRSDPPRLRAVSGELRRRVPAAADAGRAAGQLHRGARALRQRARASSAAT